jgi:hypothetical protein
MPVTLVDVEWLRQKDNLKVLRAEFAHLLNTMSQGRNIL